MNDDMDSGLQGGEQGQPTQASNQSGDQQGSVSQQPTTDLGKALQELNARLDRIERGEQSNKDRAVSRVEKDLQEFKAQTEKFLNLKGKLGDEELAWQLMNGSNKIATPSAGSEQGERVDELVNQALQAYGLDTNDPLVVAALQQNKGTAAVVKLGEIAVAKAKQPQPNAAAVAAPAGGAPESNAEQLRREYAERLQNYRGLPDKIADLKAEYRKKGLQVW